MDVKNLPNAGDLLAVLEPRPVHIAITGHVALERVIDVSIVESLPNAEDFELDRVPFNQKLALAAALGILDKTSLPAYRSLNTIRNRFAHDLLLMLEEKTMRDLRNCLSSAQRSGLSQPQPSDPVVCLREILSILYSELRSALEHGRESRLRAEAYNEITKEDLATANYGVAWVDARRTLELELRKRVEIKKQQRGWAYESPSHDDGPWDIYEFMIIAPK